MDAHAVSFTWCLAWAPTEPWRSGSNTAEGYARKWAEQVLLMDMEWIWNGYDWLLNGSAMDARPEWRSVNAMYRRIRVRHTGAALQRL
jgi:hypothetical protein